MGSGGIKREREKEKGGEEAVRMFHMGLNEDGG